MLIVPPEFNCNSPNVTSLMTPEQRGIWLLERMRQQIGFVSYADKKVLDFGCGVRWRKPQRHEGLGVIHSHRR